MLEMADNCMNPVGLGTLEGFGFKEPGERRGDEALEQAELIASPLDLLSRSRFRWHHETRAKMRLEAGPGEEVYVLKPSDGRGWWNCGDQAGDIC